MHCKVPPTALSATTPIDMTLLCWKTATTSRARAPHRRLHAQLREHQRQPTSVRFSYRLLRTGRHALRLFMRGGPSRCVGLGSSQRLSQVSAPRRPSCVLFFGYECGVTSLPIFRCPASHRPDALIPPGCATGVPITPTRTAHWSCISPRLFALLSTYSSIPTQF